MKEPQEATYTHTTESLSHLRTGHSSIFITRVLQPGQDNFWLWANTLRIKDPQNMHGKFTTCKYTITKEFYSLKMVCRSLIDTSCWHLLSRRFSEQPVQDLLPSPLSPQACLPAGLLHTLHDIRLLGIFALWRGSFEEGPIGLSKKGAGEGK